MAALRGTSVTSVQSFCHRTMLGDCALSACSALLASLAGEKTLQHRECGWMVGAKPLGKPK